MNEPAPSLGYGHVTEDALAKLLRLKLTTLIVTTLNFIMMFFIAAYVGPKLDNSAKIPLENRKLAEEIRGRLIEGAKDAERQSKTMQRLSLVLDMIDKKVEENRIRAEINAKNNAQPPAKK